MIFMNANMIDHTYQIILLIYMQLLPDVLVRFQFYFVNSDETSACFKSMADFLRGLNGPNVQNHCGTGQTTRSRTCTDPSPSIPEPETMTDDLIISWNELHG